MLLRLAGSLGHGRIYHIHCVGQLLLLLLALVVLLALLVVVVVGLTGLGGATRRQVCGLAGRVAAWRDGRRLRTGTRPGRRAGAAPSVSAARLPVVEAAGRIVAGGRRVGPRASRRAGGAVGGARGAGRVGGGQRVDGEGQRLGVVGANLRRLVVVVAGGGGGGGGGVLVRVCN